MLCPYLSLPWAFNLELRLLILCWLSLAPVVNSLVNVTVERGDEEISYKPRDGWKDVAPGMAISEISGATATLNFTGVAIYYQGWLWSQQIRLVANIDGRPTRRTLNLQDLSADNASSDPTEPVTLLIAEGLPDVAHTLVMTHVDNPDWNRGLIIGSFIYSTDRPPVDSSRNASSTSTEDSGSSSTTNTTTPISPSSSTPPGMNFAVVLPSVLAGLIFIVAIVVLSMYIVERRRRKAHGHGHEKIPSTLSKKSFSSSTTTLGWKSGHS
ncbi:hypothetical protein FA15DRAFT_669274, partial [Coprinopsis marcescibilis]